nr:transposase, mutator type [Tanacetum cinerariifolium]
MVKISFDLNEPKDSSNTDKAIENGRTPKSLTLEIYHGECFTPIPSRSYVGGQVSSVNVDDIDELYLHDLKDMVVKMGYGLADLMYYNFLIPILGLGYGLHLLNVDADVLEMEKYVNDYKIILIYVEHGSSIFVTLKKGVSIADDNHLRKECADDRFEDLDEILVDDVLDLEMLFETKGVGPVGKFKEVKVDADNESEEESDT